MGNAGAGSKRICPCQGSKLALHALIFLKLIVLDLPIPAELQPLEFNSSATPSPSSSQASFAGAFGIIGRRTQPCDSHLCLHVACFFRLRIMTGQSSHVVIASGLRMTWQFLVLGMPPFRCKFHLEWSARSHLKPSACLGPCNRQSHLSKQILTSSHVDDLPSTQHEPNTEPPCVRPSCTGSARQFTTTAKGSRYHWYFRKGLKLKVVQTFYAVRYAVRSKIHGILSNSASPHASS